MEVRNSKEPRQIRPAPDPPRYRYPAPCLVSPRKPLAAAAARPLWPPRQVRICISQIPTLFAHTRLTLFFYNHSGVHQPPSRGGVAPRGRRERRERDFA